LNARALQALEQAPRDTLDPGLSRIRKATSESIVLAVSAITNDQITQARQSIARLPGIIRQLSGPTPERDIIAVGERSRVLAAQATALLDDRAEAIDLATTIARQVTRHQDISNQLTRTGNQLLIGQNSGIQVASKAARDTVWLSGILLATLVVLALVLLAAITVLLDRSISRRLQELQTRIRLIASGERPAAELHEGADEFTEIGQSLSTIVDTLDHQESSLRTAKREAISANRTKTLFLANVSHELRTPLNAILGFSEIIRTGALGPAQPGRYGDYANDIHESGQQLLGLINDVVEASKIEAGKTGLEETRNNVEAALQDSVRQVSQLARETQVTLATDVQSQLAPLYADSRMLDQMCTCLIENAIDSSSPGSTVTVIAKIADTGQLALSIVDTGLGMSETELSRALKPMERTDMDYAREKDGSGLGLSLITQYIYLHGGELKIDSHPGVGTTATILFPASRLLSTRDRQFTVINGKT
jgi:signal transduction histidine kinase